MLYINFVDSEIYTGSKLYSVINKNDSTLTNVLTECLIFSTLADFYSEGPRF
jgi:hypothetical protein